MTCNLMSRGVPKANITARLSAPETILRSLRAAVCLWVEGVLFVAVSSSCLVYGE